MEVKIIKYPKDEDWLTVRNNALFTHRQESDIIPSSSLKNKFLASEHSPIRSLEVIWEWHDLPYWVSVHFVRHHIGILHFVSSQRNDIQKLYNRKKAPQDSPVNHRCVANVQEIINISKARRCLTASGETRQAWELMLKELNAVMPELIHFCVPPCVYRNGICPELFSDCRYNETEKFKKELDQYLTYFVKNKKG